MRGFRSEIEINGVTIRKGDEIEVRIVPGSEWVRRKFQEASEDGQSIWCISNGLSSSDARHWDGAFDIKWCVRLPNTLDVIVKKISEP